MGNLQSEVKGHKTSKQGKVMKLMKVRGKKGNKSDDVSFTGVVPEDAEAEDGDEEEQTLKDTTETKTPLLVTDSWCKVNQEEPNTVMSPGAESSSDSVFADPLTPVGFSTEVNQCYQSEEEEENFSAALNSFKLNHHFNRTKQDEITQKLSKLGVCKTSQISLDGEGQGNFESGNVEVVMKNENDDSEFEISDTHEDKQEVSTQIKKRFSEDISGKCSC